MLFSLTVPAAVEECTEKGCLALSLLELLGFNLTFVFLASLLVLIQVRLRSAAAPYTASISSHTGAGYELSFLLEALSAQRPQTVFTVLSDLAKQSLLVPCCAL